MEYIIEIKLRDFWFELMIWVELAGDHGRYW